MVRSAITALLLISSATALHASSDDAWAEMAKDAARACVEKSGFADATTSTQIIFGDDVGMVALIVTGTHQANAIAGEKGTALCLYDRRNKTASVEEALDWQGAAAD